MILESLRKWPNAIGIDRQCNAPFMIQAETPEENPIFLEKDSIIWIPIIAIHRDPEYYPNPNCFNPERFSDENKSKIQSSTFLPFGIGPRNCIGNRFSLLVAKTLICYVLRHFEIVPVKKTQIPLKMNKKKFNLVADNGFWLGLKKRQIL